MRLRTFALQSPTILPPLLCLLWLLAGPPVVAAEPAAAPSQPAAHDATTVIAQFQETLLSVMKQAGKLGYQGRYQQLAPAVKRTLDIPAIAQIALGQYWSKLDAKQRSQWVDTFTRLSIATYAARFNGYSGEKFTAPTMRPLQGGYVLVQSKLVQSGGDTVSFDYQMRQVNGQWQAINIVANGVSDLALKRAQYVSVIRNSGFDELVRKVKQKISEYEQGKAD
ncbi:MAG TPA: ABC transporter substrate-binding protein [Burkholderiales bacterium]|jgi:phospholipid transport system substrate-binding protein|nr:ABC transporter substrate-binding protein [Burkholderiales bacterium]